MPWSSIRRPLNVSVTVLNKSRGPASTSMFNSTAEPLMKRRVALVLAATTLALTGCQGLDLETLDRLSKGDRDVSDILGDELAQALNIGVAGLSPSPQYASNGAIDFSLVSRGSSGSSADVSVQVKNRDGSFSDCEDGGGVVVGASPMNVLSLLIDGSGSMEVTYTDGTCDTCPHDPGRERVGAAHRFIDTMYDLGPQHYLAIGEFGPTPSYGFDATALHADFNDDRRQLWTALDSIGGHEPIGTPLYDSVFEMIEATSAQADVLSYEGVQRHVVVLSDGQDNASVHHQLDDAIAAALAHDVRVYVVGLGPASAADTRFADANYAIRDLQTLAEATGGFYAGVDDPSGLHEMFDNVAYALAGGYERNTYRCVPRDHADAPASNPPSRGTRVEGRLVEISTGLVSSEWAFIAP